MAGRKSNLAVVDDGNVNGAPTRKQRQATKAVENAEKALEDKIKAENAILKAADQIGRITCKADEHLKAQARLIRRERELASLKAQLGRIVDLLGNFDQKDGQAGFAEAFVAKFADLSYRCPAKNCGAEATLILPLHVVVKKLARLVGDDQEISPKNHPAQWEYAAFHISEPGILQGMVICNQCQPAVQRTLEEYYPENPRGWQLHPVKGFLYQLAKNRWEMLRADRAAVDEKILQAQIKLDELNREFAVLEMELAQEQERVASIRELVV